jgi:ATP-binding cassette subfamily B protein
MYGAHADHGATIAEAAADARRAGMRLARLGAISNPVVRITATGSLVIVLVAGATRVSEGVISIGELVTLFLFTLYSLAPLQDVYNGLTSLQTAAAANSRIEDILARPTETLDPEPVTPTHHTPGTEVPSDRLLEASNVGFSYGDQRVLEDVSFRLDRNQVTAVIGQSGAGKSTLLSLICRFFDPHAGRLVFAGQPYRSLALPDLRGRIALVEQDNPVLHGSLRDNLVMGRPDAADDEIWDVLRQVSLDRFIDQLPHGLDTHVLDRGRALSGGQRQRLAIARALLSPADLILLDEPTAHLDRVNEYAMTDTLMQQRQHRSLLVVAHRMSTVEHADHILVLDRGRITDRGTHTDLLAHSTRYRRLVHEHHGPTDTRKGPDGSSGF